jgi:hypothetical protein
MQANNKNNRNNNNNNNNNLIQSSLRANSTARGPIKKAAPAEYETKDVHFVITN